MKQTLLLLFFGYMGLNAFQAQTSSNLVIFSEDATPFYLIVNGIKQNIEAQSNIKISGLTNNANAINVVFSNSAYGKLTKSIYFQQMGVEATIKITHTKKGYKMRYFGEVPINQAPASNAWQTDYHTTDPLPPTTNPVITPTPLVTPVTGNGTGTTTSSSTTATGNGTVTTTTSTSSTVKVSKGAIEDLKYTWTPGSAYGFSATVTDHINTSMMGMNIQEEIRTVTDFVLLVTGTTSTGDALGTLYLTNFKVTDSKQHVLASINNLPKSAVQGDVMVDRKGRFTFKKKVMLITSGASNVLAYASATDNSVQMGGQAGNVKVDAYAEFDPKTGALKSGYKVQEIKTTKKVDVAMNEQTQLVDVFPYDFLELLALPDGAVASGDNMTVKAGLYSMNVNVVSMENNTAVLHTTMTTDKNADQFDGGAKGTSGGADIDMNIQNMGGFEGMEGLEGAEMTKEDKEAVEMSKAMSPDMNCDITNSFNYLQGMFQSVSGTVNTRIDVMGMKMNVTSVLEMKKM